MRLGLISCAVLLCALPASGDSAVMVSPAAIAVLAPLDSIPSRAALDDAFGGPQAALANLLAIAGDPAVDLGIVLHAIRALPAYCPPAPQVCGANTAAHDALAALVDSYRSSQRTPQDLLRLRAAVEALGATRSGLAPDVDKLVPLLGNPSRDMRATVVRALRNLCNTTASGPLSGLLPYEPTMQVRLAILAALPDLARCAN